MPVRVLSNHQVIIQNLNGLVQPDVINANTLVPHTSKTKIRGIISEIISDLGIMTQVPST
jgi:hypothetical protein